jgi:ATP-dependent Clp protease ATP-binding subunit ClpA
MRPTTLDPTKTGDEAESLEAGLRQRIIGQEDAIRQVVETYQTYVSGMASPGRPIANLMFLGPTGSRNRAWWKPQRSAYWETPEP